MAHDDQAAYQPAAFTINDVDALLVLSFGGPEGVDEVRPFLENVTAGRGIPPERLDEVGAHYYHFDGVSPLNELNREIIANVEAELQKRGHDLPVYFGNRNWRPFAAEAYEQIKNAGHRNVAVFATSAWGGYSGCRQYGEDIQEIADESITYFRLPQFFANPTFLDLEAQATRNAYAELGYEDPATASARLVFTAHSIPVPADASSGLPSDAALYSNQVREAARLTAKRLGVDDFDVVWQSASGNGRIPWLEPDIVDHAEALHEQGVKDIVVVPIGFISDHMEVIWDLDNELREATEEWGMGMARAATVGPEQGFAEMVVDLLENPAGVENEGEVASRGCTVNGTPCAEGCCQPRKRPHSTQA